MSARRKSLKKRVASYAKRAGTTNRIARMIRETCTMEFVRTRTETEALLLEANLIKRLRPRFNVLLRDDKSFPYIVITDGPSRAGYLQASRRTAEIARIFRPVRQRRSGQPHDQRHAAGLPAPLLHGLGVREPHAAVPACTRSSAARGPAPGEISPQDYAALVNEAPQFPFRQEQRDPAAPVRAHAGGLRGNWISRLRRSSATGWRRFRMCRRIRASTRAASRRRMSSRWSRKAG